jgi:hypothetical protein
MQSPSLSLAALLRTCVLVAAGTAGTAFAQESGGWYAGAGLGAARGPACGELTSCDRTGTQGRLTIGRQLNERFSLEGSYVDLRGMSGSLADPTLGTVKADFSGRGFELAGLVHSREFNGFSGYAKFGIAAMTTTAKVSIAALAPLKVSISDRELTPVAGFGASYRINPKLALQAGYDWRRLSLEGDSKGVHGVTAGLRLNF